MTNIGTLVNKEPSFVFMLEMYESESAGFLIQALPVV